MLLFTLLAYTFSQYLNLNTNIISYKKQIKKYEKVQKKSITFDELSLQKKNKICKYINARYRRISSPVVKLISEEVVAKCEYYNIPPGIVMGIMEVESGFDPAQVSSAKARGLMQVRWPVWSKLLKEETKSKNEFDLHEIDKGIQAGIVVFKYYIKKNNGDMTGALYDYVGKSKGYAEKVYKATGRFMLYD